MSAETSTGDLGIQKNVANICNGEKELAENNVVDNQDESCETREGTNMQDEKSNGKEDNGENSQTNIAKTDEEENDNSEDCDNDDASSSKTKIDDGEKSCCAEDVEIESLTNESQDANKDEEDDRESTIKECDAEVKSQDTPDKNTSEIWTKGADSDKKEELNNSNDDKSNVDKEERTGMKNTRAQKRMNQKQKIMRKT
eukprot:TRINITY_DN13811_c0_g1_i3.p1 TRINITY_DN13811_c0_g1~~TRINITY_DN13811_c0_g1_i3.p1  ORF type:complete len:199 (+),score=69.71 TRINITY_DN13811_c0_g1_i3:61-657(+)